MEESGFYTNRKIGDYLINTIYTSHMSRIINSTGKIARAIPNFRGKDFLGRNLIKRFVRNKGIESIVDLKEGGAAYMSFRRLDTLECIFSWKRYGRKEL